MYAAHREHDIESDRAADAQLAAEDAMDSMKADADQVEAFLVDTGENVHSLLAMLFQRGMPKREGSARDLRFFDRCVTELDRVETAFTTWANTASRFDKKTPLERYMAARDRVAASA